MQIFINETSLHGQYAHPVHFFESLDVFVSTIKRISELKNDKNVLRSDTFYYYTGVNDISFEGLLKQNTSLAWTFRENLQKLNPKSWEKQKIHDASSSYEFNKEPLTGTTVAEIAERKLQDKTIKGVLINFIESKYGNNPNIDIVKDNTDTIRVDCAMTPESIESWLITNGIINLDEIYNEKSGIAPADYQTVLKDNTKFEKTTYPKNNGRIVYRRIGTNELWVVDSAIKHAGAKAHIEIFDENSRKHLGTSLYNQVKLDIRYKVDNRSINLG
ncbi:hypothetical protein CMT77_05815 [Elizabethkingia anophelis]|nr:hypothetical protein [Elizabethkingia anophelis]